LNIYSYAPNVRDISTKNYIAENALKNTLLSVKRALVINAKNTIACLRIVEFVIHITAPAAV
jgi:hypothetical protein